MGTSVEIRVLAPQEFTLYWSLYKEAVEAEPEAFAHTIDDIEEVDAPEAACWFSNSTIIGCFESGSLVAVVRVDRRIPQKLSHKAELSSLYVLPRCRGRGLGRRLLAYTMEQLARSNIERLRLYVNVGNACAIGLYAGLGFTAYAREKAAMRLPGGYADQLVMEADLTEAIRAAA